MHLFRLSNEGTFFQPCNWLVVSRIFFGVDLYKLTVNIGSHDPLWTSTVVFFLMRTGSSTQHVLIEYVVSNMFACFFVLLFKTNRAGPGGFTGKVVFILRNPNCWLIYRVGGLIPTGSQPCSILKSTLAYSLQEMA